MRFKLATTVQIGDEDTDTPKPFGDWDDYDRQLAVSKARGCFTDAIAVEYDNVSDPQNHLQQHDDTTGYYEMMFEVDERDVQSTIGNDRVSLVVLKKDYTASDYENAIIAGDGGFTIEFIGW